MWLFGREFCKRWKIQLKSKIIFFKENMNLVALIFNLLLYKSLGLSFELANYGNEKT